MLTLCSSIFAQDGRIRDERKVPEEQVPIMVRNAFEKEFSMGEENKKGTWFIYYEQYNEGSRTVAKPLAYIYRTRKEGEKVEIKYNAAGEFETAKGISRKATDASGSN